ncbi:SDR family oxidoreductase [Leucobacter sp. Ag1]|uniref:SDR family oxidoreductase n=1 Tax=unclassified Leucobacter TaxID=2621730 RepID=UPI00062133B4|nr:SDR family oxidoreductase [Leucobacter sp. Ag1]KKI21214.1 short-chain dehydrogenase [Leucobacter sp. Ag1]
MQHLMAGRILLVTGGTQGLGLAIARAAAREGAAGIAIVGRSAEKAERALVEIHEAALWSDDGPANAIAIVADLATPGEAERAVAETIARFGRIDSLVNAAALPTRGSLTDTTRELLGEHLAVNLVAPFMTMQGAVADLQRRGAPGTIVNIITISSHGGQPYLAPYVASKAGLAGLTKNAAFAHRFDRIRINGLNIGWTATPGENATQQKFHGAEDGWLEQASAGMPMGKLGQPDEIADAVVFLLSDRSGVVTGSIIDWDQTVIGAYE